MKKRALVDVDGVVADFSQHVIDSVGSSLTVADITRWDIFGLIEEADGSAKKVAALAAMEDMQFWNTLPIMEGAVEGLKELRKTYDVFWVTSPWPTCHGWDVARRNWIVKNFQASPDHVVVTNAKFICAGNVFIDDKIDNVKAWAEHNPEGRALLFSAPYNSSCNDYEFFQW